MPISPSRHTQAAQRAEKRPTLHHREGHAVVDQEHADDERQQAERGQIRTERGCHLRQGAGAGAHGHNLRVTWEQICQISGRVSARQNQVDVVQLADLPGELLCGGDISQDHAVQRGDE